MRRRDARAAMRSRAASRFTLAPEARSEAATPAQRAYASVRRADAARRRCAAAPARHALMPNAPMLMITLIAAADYRSAASTTMLRFLP